ncbi:type II toxin-antitoxin system RelE/ParE family toxin [Pseudomonas sp. CFBP 13719]|uniref:type II toxin-antitoxin system RelE/ParE family toxin n=1 Tax=Pseudomonas sp. CFBP 13719 TaxID=2775303 RepID=UPI0017861FA6|nr:type II toxin-antitoxin system RelE/ParE family toxin [Pseudomonas sp. CFBP 13719]MBD8682815.1 type II toxin-antitoxin system RelE/ParE family toxin [Pseudomonas sp. CFBP 13719]
MNKKTSDTNDNESKTRVLEYHPEKAAFKEMATVPERIRDAFLLSLSMVLKHLEPACQVSPLGGLGKNVYELKINGRPAWRCIYYTGITGKIVVLHVTEKTTNGRDSQIANVVEQRLKTLRDELKVGRKK